jgi:GNAT superfamily N-acetyltransferase
MDADRRSRRDRLLAFELDLAAAACEEPAEADWGRLVLTPSLPRIWVANMIVLEAAGMTAAEVAAMADRELGGRGCEHRYVLVAGEEEGRRLATEAATELPDWMVERTEYMEHVPGTGGRHEGLTPVRESGLDAVAALRRGLAREGLEEIADDAEAVSGELLEHSRRLAAVAGDRWFTAPAAGPPQSMCCLLRREGLGQIEDVATQGPARNRGLATATVLAALAASRDAGDEATFLTADAADWPRLFYARLGFDLVGEVTVLRWDPAAPSPA